MFLSDLSRANNQRFNTICPCYLKFWAHISVVVNNLLSSLLLSHFSHSLICVSLFSPIPLDRFIFLVSLILLRELIACHYWRSFICSCSLVLHCLSFRNSEHACLEPAGNSPLSHSLLYDVCRYPMVSLRNKKTVCTRREKLTALEICVFRYREVGSSSKLLCLGNLWNIEYWS